MTTTLLPVRFTPPWLDLDLPHGLYAATVWPAGAEDRPRWLAAGLEIELLNFTHKTQVQKWTQDWCGPASEITDSKAIDREDRPDPPVFTASTAVAWDQTQCGDLSIEARSEAHARAAKILELNEQLIAEKDFATALLAADGTPGTVADLVTAIGFLEAKLLATGTTGLIHADAKLAAVAAEKNLLRADLDGTLRTPLGHRWVLGGGYVDTLGGTLVATTPVYGWQSTVVQEDTVEHTGNRYYSMAERSVVLGYERLVASVTIT